MTLLTLFISFVQIGLFSFGGGYAALPLIQEQVVTQHGWLSMAELTDLITISQMTPGPIAINSATFVGMKIAGLPGPSARPSAASSLPASSSRPSRSSTSNTAMWRCSRGSSTPSGRRSSP